MGGKSNPSSFRGPNPNRFLTTHNKYHDGVKAPRNSLDLPPETANRHTVINDNFMVNRLSPKMNFLRDEMPVKVTANDEIATRENYKGSGPSIVARLMGMDTLPFDNGQKITAKEYIQESPRKHISRVPRFVSANTQLSTISSANLIQPKELSPPNKKQHSSPSTKSQSSVKMHRREHPQEELLQKFKKEFESWQASQLWEGSNNSDQNDSSQGSKNEQILALEKHNMEKAVRHANTSRNSVHKKPIETDVHISASKVKIAPNQADGHYHNANADKQSVSRTKDDTAVRRKMVANSFEPVSKAMYQEKRSSSSSPTRIVILKPSSEISEIEEPWGGSFEPHEKEITMEHFLEEVKERLRFEMEGKGRIDSARWGNATHTSLHERSTDPKQLARDIAKHVRESVTRDTGATLGRMESTRPYRNANELESSDTIKKDTRKFISDRLKNVLINDAGLEKPLFNDGRAGNSLLIKEKARSKSMTDFSKEGKGASFWEDKKAVNESIPKYLRREQLKMAEFEADAMSPPDLIRSFSAPASGATFGKLLMEDHRGMIEAQKCKIHENSEYDSAVINRNKKDGFNFKGRVSNFRRNLGLKGKIFGKKMSSIGESTSETFSHGKHIDTMPSMIRSYHIVEDNSTEVPPSPASFASSPINEHHTPVSPFEIPFAEEHSSTQVSGEINMTPLESASQPEQINNKISEAKATETRLHSINETSHIESHAKSYVREILDVSGLRKHLSRLDDQTEAISSSVFEEVEEKYDNLCRLGDVVVNRRMLFDLVNEVLPSVLHPHAAFPKRLKWGFTESPSGTKLLDCLLIQIQAYANPKIEQPRSADEVVAWDVKMRPWLTSPYEDIGFVEQRVEEFIFEELIDELVSDLLFYGVT